MPASSDEKRDLQIQGLHQASGKEIYKNNHTEAHGS